MIPAEAEKTEPLDGPQTHLSRENGSPRYRNLSGLAERAEVDHRICEKLECEMPGLDSFETEQQSLEFVLPCERSFHSETLLMDGLIEETFSAAFGFLSVSLVLRNVGNHAPVEDEFSVFLNRRHRQD